MSLVLAATWEPRGEVNRLRRLFPLWQTAYSSMVFSLSPDADSGSLNVLQSLPAVRVVQNGDWSQGRFQALKAALESDTSHIHYADLDRLIRWTETRPDEWRATIEAVGRCDYLVIGRTDAAWATHPQAMFESERVQNTLFSHLTGITMDIGAGSKGFSREAAAFIIANSSPERALGADSEWTILAQRGGFEVESCLVDGLDFETADRYQDSAADSAAQKQVADAYDSEAIHWSQRLAVTQEVIESGLDAMNRKLTGGKLRYLEVRRHTMRIKPGQRLSQSGVDLARRIGATTGPFDRVVTSTVPRAYETAIAMGCAVDEELESLSLIPEDVFAEIAWDEGFAAWGRVAKDDNAAARYGASQAALWRSIVEALPPGGRALIVAHGGIVEAGAVGCLPDADYESWGGPCSWCEGVRLAFDGQSFVAIDILRINGEQS